MFGCYINRTTQNIIISTYLFAKVRYGMVITWDLIPITRRRRLNTMLRACTKGIRDCTAQSENRFFELVENYEPMGLRILQRMFNIRKKLREYYRQDLETFDRLVGDQEEYWEQYIKECCPELAGHINIKDVSLMKKNKQHKKREIQLLFWKIKSLELDPQQGKSLENRPRVIEDKSDWTRFRDSTKLMVMNYYTMRHNSDCVSCRKRGKEVQEKAEGSSTAVKKQQERPEPKVKHDRTTAKKAPCQRERKRTKPRYGHNPNKRRCEDFQKFEDRLKVINGLTW